MAFALLGARSAVARRFYQTSAAGRCRLHHTCLRPRGPSRPAAPPRLTHSEASRRSFFSWQKPKKTNPRSAIPAAIVVGTLLITSLYPHDEIQRLKAQEKRSKQEPEHAGNSTAASEQNAWFDFSTRFEQLSNSTDVEWGKISDKLVETIFPEWSKYVPGYVRKLQREMSMAPGSLADEIWDEAHDPLVNPEVQYTAKVRISDDLCEEEKEFLVRRKRIATVALARYLGLKEEDVHPDDVPTIAMCGSGGGLRALVAGTGSWAAASEDGLFDCVTYTSGVSGSCWLQSLYYSSITGQDVGRLADHLKARLGVHIAYPPVAFQALTAAPTNKYLLSGVIEKLKGDTSATFGLVDVYGILLAARLLVPKGELGVNERDFKLSNQRQYVKYGQNPLPIYTAVRHEIPDAADETTSATGVVTEEAKAKAKQEAWFQWFEITPYEFFCEEFSAGIPTWALGRKFKDGQDVPPERGFHLPELRMPLMLGIFGSAFCATLSHYYREIRPLIKNLTGFGAVDELVYGHNEDLSKVHPIDPAMLPNPVYGMKGKLPKTTPSTLYDNEYIQLMDAGMSNNIPLYPFLRPGRNVEIVIAFDASADIKTDNWLSVADGYARQRGIKGWPVGIGWPKPGDSPKKLAKELDESSAGSSAEAEAKLSEAKAEQEALRRDAGRATDEDAVEERKYEQGEEAAGELGYCTVWVGTTQERSSGETPPPSKAVDDSSDWQLMEPDAGITVVYLPFLVNDKVPGVDPAASEYMSTWNFVYTPDQVDQVMALARANYAEGRERIRRTVRAVYERKKKVRLEEAARRKEWRYRKLVRKGVAHKLGEGDQFS